jgi:uncharacterized protein YggT (Ycf19 family)
MNLLIYIKMIILFNCFLSIFFDSNKKKILKKLLISFIRKILNPERRFIPEQFRINGGRL